MDPDYPQLKPKDFTGDQKAKDALAVKLITEAGYGKGKPLTIAYFCTSDDLHKKETEAIAAMWKHKLGVVSRIKLEDSDTLYADFEKLQWDAYCDGLVGDYAGAEPFLVYRTDAAGAGYPWKNDAYEAAMADAVKLTDPAARKQALAKAEQILLDDYPIAPLLQASKRNLIDKRVAGWVDNPIGYHLTKYLQIQ
jgi:oligopeptide transport system substrate-binding protein